MNIDNNDKRVVLTPKDSSNYITSYIDGDILEYDGGSSVRLPVNADRSKYRVISEAEHLDYEAQKEFELAKKT